MKTINNSFIVTLGPGAKIPDDDKLSDIDGKQTRGKKLVRVLVFFSSSVGLFFLLDLFKEPLVVKGN
jgi:hypothetical protein